MRTFSICIPVYNALPFLDKLLPIVDQLITLDVPVLFIDSSSTDGSNELLCSKYGEGVVTIPTENFDHGATRSLARDYIKTDVVVYLTQDALPKTVDDFFKLLKVFDDKDVAAAYGRQLAYEDTNSFGKHLREFNYPADSRVVSIEDRYKYGVKTAQLSNSFAAYRCSAMDKIGWFKDRLILGEDVYAGAKLLKEGFKLAYVSEAEVYHSHSYTAWEEFKRYFDIGVFHKMEHWIITDFGKTGGEGKRYIKSEWSYLTTRKLYRKLPAFVFRNGFKLVGYKLGLNFAVLPKPLIRGFSMHHRWWKSLDV